MEDRGQREAERPIPGVRGGDDRASCAAQGGALVTVSAAFSSAAPDVVCNYVQRAGSVHLSFSPVNEVVDISILLQSLS